MKYAVLMVLLTLTAALLFGCMGGYPEAAPGTETVSEDTAVTGSGEHEETAPFSTGSASDSSLYAEMPDPFATTETTPEEEHPFLPM